MKLDNKVAIVTGAGSGIGKETALLFSKEGAKVVVADINEKSGKDTLDDIEQSGGEGIYLTVDISSKEQDKDMAEKVIVKYGRIDILVNNGGINKDSLFSKMTEEQWDKVIDVNLKGTYNCAQAVMDIMVTQHNGVIINVSSIVGLYGNVGQVNYAAAKAGIIGLTKSLAKELGPKGIRINAIAPGFIQTPMTAKVPEKLIKMFVEKTPLRRMGTTKDVANANLFLVSDDASFVNGAVICVDGGLTL